VAADAAEAAEAAAVAGGHVYQPPAPMYSSGVSGPGPMEGMNVDALHRAAPPSTLTASTTMMAAAPERAKQCIAVPYLVPRVAIFQLEDDGFSWLPDDGEEDEGTGGEKREEAASGVVRGSGRSGSGDDSGGGEEKRGNGDTSVVDSSSRSHDEHSGGAEAKAKDAEEAEEKGRVRLTHDNAIVLKGLNLTVSSGELVLVVGPVGSGKSTLLAALLGLVSPVPRGGVGGGLRGGSMGEATEYLGEGDNGPRSPPPPSSHGSPQSRPPLTRPHAHPHGAFLRDAWGSLKPAAAAVLGGRHQLRAAFASQRPWIQNTSLRGNVLFGLPFHEATYRRVIQVRSMIHVLYSLQVCV